MPDWTYPLIAAAIVAAGAFLLRTLVKYYVNKIDERLIAIDKAAEEFNKAVGTLTKELSTVRESLPKEYVLKPDCIAGRASIEKHLTGLTRKVDRILEKLAGFSRG